MAQSIAALLGNMGAAEAAYQTALNSQGSAEKENQRYIESIDGQLNILQNKWNEVWVSTVNRDALKFLIQVGQALLDIVNNVGLLQTIGIGGGIFALFKNAGRDEKSRKSFAYDLNWPNTDKNPMKWFGNKSV